MQSISIDLGGTRCKMALVINNQVASHTIIDSHSDQGVQALLPEIESCIHLLLKNQNIKVSDIAGIGMAMPGIIDSNSASVISINGKFIDAVGFSFTQWSQDKFNKPIVIENDARAALIGSWKYGAGKGYQNLVAMTIGTGIGTAALVEGHVLRGKHFTAGNLGGHFIVNYQGHECNCGNKGCVEAEASTWQLNKLVKEDVNYKSSSLHKEEVLNFKVVTDHFVSGDRLAKKVLQNCIQVWAAGIINTIHAYDPECVILSGGIMSSHKIILPQLQEIIDRRAWTPIEKVKLINEPLAESAALLGMNYLITGGNSEDVKL